MARTWYCRWDDCGKPVDVIAGDAAGICPACQRTAKWASEPGHPIKERRKTPRWTLSYNDGVLLKRFGIAKE